METVGKVMGIDYGTVRIGLAVSDSLGMLARPLLTVSGRKEDRPVEAIAGIIDEEKIEQAVIGIPDHADGREGAITVKVREFVALLREAVGEDFPIHEADEWGSTLAAREKLRAAGKKEAEIDEMIDQAAAAEILQNWLDRRCEMPG